MKNIEDTFAELRKKNYATTKELYELGINKNDIKNLINKNYLKRVCTGYYKVNVKGTDFDCKKSFLRRARDEYNKKNYTKALFLLNRYVHLNSSNKAHYLLYLIWLKKNNYEKAYEELKTSYQLNNNEDKEILKIQLYIFARLVEKEKINNELMSDIKLLIKKYCEKNQYEEIDVLSNKVKNDEIRAYIKSLLKDDQDIKRKKL